MRVMMMHKSDAACEAGALPSPKLIEDMGKLMGEMAQAGVVLAGEGLRPTSTGVRLKFKGGQRTIIPGPYAGSNELIAGFAIVRVKSIDEAIEWSTRFAKIMGDVEIDIRPINEPWDLGMCPKPAGDDTTRYMMAHKADKSSEAGTPPSPEMMAAMGRLIGEMQQAGVFLTGEGLEPSSKSKRLKYVGGKCTVTDGPFAESKELIAGFVILNVASVDEAIKWTPKFAACVGDVEIDIRPLHEAENCG